ncbi:endonuclease/exonuclease/phosphatase family protein [Xanthobacter pseudotagetidis]|uniref:endonuclease/exonuclease/phosphatase family protein n=1 Tax=Xanthobacter pseudotagetidis TaxID=3119911 RepID=UPI003729311A
MPQRRRLGWKWSATTIGTGIMATLKVLLWNLEWQRAGTPGGTAARAIMADCDADLVCLTEANLDILPVPHLIAGEADFGGPSKPGRRKVMLWSRSPWTGVDGIGRSTLPPGRFVRGRTQTPLGPLDVIGVCIPWRMAQVATGRRDSKPWQEHMRYLDGLEALLSGSAGTAPNLLLGDFNQAIPRRSAPYAVSERLNGVLAPRFPVATAGAIAGLSAPAIDHLAFGAGLRCRSVVPLANVGGTGRRISDHVGLLITLEAA